MAADKAKSILSMLRRTGHARSAADENALWLLHERAVAHARESGNAAQRLASSLAKQRGTVDAAADRMRIVTGRAQELAVGMGRIVDALERLGLVALNAGLEGARLGEGPGRALLLVSDEVRTHAARGADGGREIAAQLGELASELVQVQAQLGHARETSDDVAQQAARTAGAAAEVEKTLAELSERLRKATGSDPETVRALTDAAEHARALVTALGTLTGKVPRSLLVGALKPALEPLVRLLESDEEDDEEKEKDREKEKT